MGGSRDCCVCPVLSCPRIVLGYPDISFIPGYPRIYMYLVFQHCSNSIVCLSVRTVLTAQSGPVLAPKAF